MPMPAMPAPTSRKRTASGCISRRATRIAASAIALLNDGKASQISEQRRLLGAENGFAERIAVDPADGDEQHQSDGGAQLAMGQKNSAQHDHRTGNDDFRTGQRGALEMRGDAGHHRHNETDDEPPSLRVRGGETADGDHGGEMVEADDRMAEAGQQAVDEGRRR